MPFQRFVPQKEIADIQVNEKDLYLDANAVNDADIFNQNIPFAPEEENDEEPDEMVDINHETRAPSLSDVYSPEVVARRT